MSGYDNKMIFFFFNFAGCYLLIASLFVKQALALECVVCLPSDETVSIAKETRRLFTKDDKTPLIYCHQINSSAEALAAIRTCPPESANSCQVQKTSTWTAKSCSFVKADDCQMANRVEYCYCQSNRCNEPLSTTTMTTTVQIDPTTIKSTLTSPSTWSTPDQHHSSSTVNRIDTTLITITLFVVYFSQRRNTNKPCTAL